MLAIILNVSADWIGQMLNSLPACFAVSALLLALSFIQPAIRRLVGDCHGNIRRKRCESIIAGFPREKESIEVADQAAS
jgi:hypothetical protein